MQSFFPNFTISTSGTNSSTSWGYTTNTVHLDQLIPVVHTPPASQPKTALVRLDERIGRVIARVGV